MMGTVLKWCQECGKKKRIGKSKNRCKRCRAESFRHKEIPPVIAPGMKNHKDVLPR